MNYQDQAASSFRRREETQRSDGPNSGPTLRRTKRARVLRQPNKNDSIRAAYLSNVELGAFGRRFGAGSIRALPEFKPFDFIARQKENEADILKAYRSTREATESGEMITPAAEWLLDNHYLVEENVRQVARGKPFASPTSVTGNCR